MAETVFGLKKKLTANENALNRLQEQHEEQAKELEASRNENIKLSCIHNSYLDMYAHLQKKYNLLRQDHDTLQQGYVTLQHMLQRARLQLNTS